MKFVYGRKYLLHILAIHAMTLILYAGVALNFDVSLFLFIAAPPVFIGIITIRSGVGLDSRYIACHRKEDASNGYGLAVTGNFLAAIILICFDCLIRFT